MKIQCNQGGSEKLPKSMVLSKVSEAYDCPPEELKATLDWQGLASNPDLKMPVSAEWKPFHSFLIDTVRVKVAVNHLPLAEFTKGNTNVKRNGFKFIVTCPKTGASAQVLSRKGGTELIIEFSIPKFLKGQNVAGHLDVHEGCLAGIKKALKLLGVFPSKLERQAISRGDYHLTRVDITVHVDCGTAELAQALLMALRGYIVNHGQDVSMYGVDTLYIGQHSKRRTLKIYNKGHELEQKNQQIPDHVYGSRYLTRKAKSLARLELTLRGKELTRKKLTSPLAWDEVIAKDLITPWIKKLKCASARLPDTQGIDQLSPVMQLKLRAWLLGDLIAFSRSVTPGTCREGRNKVFKATGIDIDTPLTPGLQASCVTTIRDLFERGFGFRSYGHKWDRLLAAANNYQPAQVVTTSQPKQPVSIGLFPWCVTPSPHKTAESLKSQASPEPKKAVRRGPPKGMKPLFKVAGH